MTNSYGLIEISTYCSENCNYCRLRNENHLFSRQRMNRERIIEIAKEINIAGIKSIVIRSGYDEFYDVDRIAYIIYSIKKYADVNITLSLGQRTFEEYKEWKIAGATGYRLRFKSSNPVVYHSLDTHGSFENRLNHIRYLKSLAYKVCSGAIVGLPNQSINDVAKDYKLTKDLGLEVAEILPFQPQANTPFENCRPWKDEDIQKAIAVGRIVFQDSLRCSKPKFIFNLEESLIHSS